MRMDKLHLLKRYVGYGDLEECCMNLYQIGFVENVYKEWLKKILAGTIELGLNIPYIIADVGVKHEFRLHQLQEKFDKKKLEHRCRHSEDTKVIDQLK